MGTPNELCVRGVERNMASKMNAWRVEPVHHELPPRASDRSECVILQTPAPQYAEVRIIFISQQVKAAASAGAPGDSSRAGLSARRMRAGGIRTVTCAPMWASQYSCEK